MDFPQVKDLPNKGNQVLDHLPCKDLINLHRMLLLQQTDLVRMVDLFKPDHLNANLVQLHLKGSSKVWVLLQAMGLTNHHFKGNQVMVGYHRLDHQYRIHLLE
jgi:hypothetical protein